MHSVLVIAAVGDLSTRRDGRAAARGNLAAGKLLTHNGNNSSSRTTATTAAAHLALVVPQFFFPPTSLLGAIGFSATCELYFSRAILTTDVVVLTLYSYQYMRMMGGGPTI